MTLKISGTDRLREAAANIQRLFSPSALTVEAVRIAAEAGVILKDAVVQKCVDEIYELSGSYSSTTPLTLSGLAEALGGEYGGNPEDRTEALKNAHEVVDEGLIQRVQIDPNADAEPSPHSGREKVIDYAIPVHEGYTQWIPDGRGGSYDTGIHHIGRPWFYHAIVEHGEEVCEYVIIAFEQAAARLMASI